MQDIAVMFDPTILSLLYHYISDLGEQNEFRQCVHRVIHLPV